MPSIRHITDKCFSIFPAKVMVFYRTQCSLHHYRKDIKRITKGMPELTASQKKECNEYWKKYTNEYDSNWCRLFLAKYGCFDPRFIPNDLYFAYIDPFLNNRTKSDTMDDKNYYDLLFKDVPQAATVVRMMNGYYLDSHYNIITEKEAFDLCAKSNKLIFKQSTASCQGRNIDVWDLQKDGLESLKKLVTDMKYRRECICQAFFEQHESLSAIHKKAVNTMRIHTLIVNNEVHYMAAILKMAAGDMQVDNVHWGGCSCGIDENGRLRKYGSDVAGNSILKHPSGFVFEGFEVPGFQKAVELVKDLHQRLPNFRFVGWDIAIDKDGNPVLIEVNMAFPAIDFQQWNNGPIFGEFTDQILDEVFSHKS